MKRVYLDHNATTPLRPEVRSAMLDALEVLGGNPSSVHAPGRAARALIDEARERIAAALKVGEDQLIFTSGGTEANNLALLGVARSHAAAPLVTTPTEHSSVREVALELQREGHPLRWIEPDSTGRIDPQAVIEAAGGACLVSIQAANNEIGSLGPLRAIQSGLEELGERPLLHSDAVQALGKLPLELEAVDLASLSAHKVGGPLGVGLLVRRTDRPMLPLMWGGGQEAGLRPGTENVPGIVGAAVAISLACEEQESLTPRLRRQVSLLWQEIKAAFPAAVVLGPHPDDPDRLANTLCISFPGVDGRVLVTRLDLAGLSASAGSACSSGSLEPSHVLRALGLDDERARAGLRLSLGRTTSDQDIHNAVEILRKTL